MTSSCVQSQIQKYTDIDIDKDEYKDPKYGVNIFNVDDVEVGARVNHLCSCKLAASGGTRIHKHTQIHKNMQNILKDSNRHYSSYFVVPRGRLWSRIWRMKFFRMDAIFLDLFCTCYEVDIVLLWRVSFAKFGLKDKVYCKVLWLFIYNVWSIWFFCLQIFLTIDPLFGHEKKHHNKQSSTFFKLKPMYYQIMLATAVQFCPQHCRTFQNKRCRVAAVQSRDECFRCFWTSHSTFSWCSVLKLYTYNMYFWLYRTVLQSVSDLTLRVCTLESSVLLSPS